MHYVYDRGESGDWKVSDYVTPEKVATWEPGDIILIIAPTGSGKSYFVKHTLHEYLQTSGKKCRYYVPRTTIRNQFEVELQAVHDSTLTFGTYQALEKREDEATSYDVIVADECHYFLTDGKFNHGTDISFRWILSQRNAIRIFMTATGNEIVEYFNRRGIPYIGYVLEPEPEDVKIQSLSFFWGEAQMDVLAQQIIASGKRGIFFIEKAGEAYSLYAKYKDKSVFVCSESNSEYKKYRDEKAINALLTNEKFECPLLIATMALDTGITIKDSDLTTIVTDIFDPVEIVQCVGRKRFVDDADKVDVYIRAKSNRQVTGVLEKTRKQADTIQDFYKHGAAAYNKRNDRGNDSARLVYDSPDESGEKFVKRVNQLKYARIRNRIKMYKEILALGKYGWMDYTSQLLMVGQYSVVEEAQREQSLTEYLESLVGKPMLTKADREPLIERLDIRRDGHILKRYKALAGYLESSNLPYRLHEYTTNRMLDADGEKVRKSYRAWEIVRLSK